MQLDITNLSIDELDYFYDRTGIEIEEYLADRSRLPLRTFLRVIAGMALRREDPGISDAEIGRIGSREIMEMFDVEQLNEKLDAMQNGGAVNPPAEPPA